MRRPRGRLARAALLILIGVGAYIVVAVTALGLTALAARSVTREAVQVATAGIEAARTGETAVAQERLDTAASMFGRTASRLDGWWLKPGDLVPGLRQNRLALHAMAAAGHELSEQASRAAAAADRQQLGIQAGAVDLALLGSLEEASAELAETARVEHLSLAAADSRLLIPPVSTQLDAALRQLEDAGTEAGDLAEAARLSAGLLGGDGPRRYFLALMTPSELRGAGGMIGNFGILTADEGRVGLEELGRTRELNEGGDPEARTISGPPDYVDRYSRFLPATTWQNVTMSPDFPSVGQVIEELYPQSGGSEVDGVIGLDPAALAAFLKIVGPVSVPSWPVPITAENAEPVLLYEQYIHFPTPDRVEFLAEVVAATFDKLVAGAVPLAQAAEILGPVVESRHIQTYSRDADEQALFRRLGVHGGLPDVAGDYLGVVNQNASGSKIERFLKRSLDYEVEFDPATSTVSAVAEVTLANSAPPAGLPDYLIRPHRDAGTGGLPPGTNRTYMSLYSALQVEEVTINGEPAFVTAERELGRNVFSFFHDLPPESVTVVRYRLSGRIDSDDYQLAVRPQVFASEPERFSLRLAGTAGWVPEAGSGLSRQGTSLVAEQRLTRDFETLASFTRP